MEVEIRNDVGTTTVTSRRTIEQAIQSEVKSRFVLGNNAPISCTLSGIKLRYLNNAEVAFSIINGTFPILDKLDDATKLLWNWKYGKQCTQGRLLPTAHNYPSRLHSLSQMYMRSNLFIPFRAPLGSRWSCCFLRHAGPNTCNSNESDYSKWYSSNLAGHSSSSTVGKGCWAVYGQKLRSIQLYETDLNWFMKFIFNNGALTALRSIDYLLEEHYSQKGSTAEDAALIRRWPSTYPARLGLLQQLCQFILLSATKGSIMNWCPWLAGPDSESSYGANSTVLLGWHGNLY